MTAYPAVLLRTEYMLGNIQPATFGIWFSTVNEKTSADLHDWLAGDHLTNWNTNLGDPLKACIRTDDKFTGFSAYGYNLAGELTAQSHFTLLTGNTGSGVGEGFPQIAAVVTLRTAGFGRSQRGRIYIPYTVESTDLYLTTSLVDNLAAGFGDYLSTNITQGYDPIVNSRTRDDGYAITQVRIDNVGDTQRRRRDQFVSTHTAAAVVSGD